MTALLDAVARAVHPLDTPPHAPGWNHDCVTGLVGDGARRAAAVLVGVRTTNEPRVVFTLRRNDLAQHAGQVSFPGGGAETGDVDSVATALRESREEIALDTARVEPFGYLDCIETISGFCVTPVMARVAPDAVVIAQPDEVARVFEVPLAFLLDPANVHRDVYRVRGVARNVYEYAGVEPRIWGATAAMLVNLMQRMGLKP